MNRVATLMVGMACMALSGAALADEAVPPAPEPEPEPAATGATTVGASTGGSAATTGELEADGPVTKGEGKLPVPYAKRPLTLPEMTLSPAFGFGVTHLESNGFAFNGFGLNAGAALGIIDDLTVDVTPLSMVIARTDGSFFGGSVSDTTVYYGTFRAGATYRFLHSDVADIGGRFEFGGSGTTEAIHMTAGLPVLLRLADVVRIDTGMFWTLFLPTGGGGVDGALGQFSGVGLPFFGAGSFAGIPAHVSFQIIDEFFAGLDTGFGIASFRGDVDNAMFMPLGAHLGGTLPGDDGPLLDLIGSFSFPYFLLGADSDAPTTELWAVGMEARMYFSLL